MKNTLLICIVLMLAALPASAATFYVGSCHAKSFPTISAAVSSTSVPAGSTIKVCPGTYYEQVVISKSLTLVGISSGGLGSSTITGSTADATTYSPYSTVPVRPSIWVTAGTVNITGMNVMQIYNDSDCTSWITGIYYATGTSGTVNQSNVSIRSTTAAGCQRSGGIWAENGNSVSETVTVKNSTLEVELLAIFGGSETSQGAAPLLTLNASGNLIFSASTVAGGIKLDQAAGTVSGNTVVSAVGIWAGANTVVSGNTIDSETGIYVMGTSTIKSNKIRAEFGIDMNCYLPVESGNTITGGYGAQPTTGLEYVPSAFSGKNTFYNVVTTAYYPGC